jgi:TolB-like protein/Tfp pilus assembly protein PilF
LAQEANVSEGDLTHTPPPGALADPADSPEHPHHKKHKKNKIRSAWISFIGRIIAQITGAVATIVVGLAVVNQYRDASDPSGAADGSEPTSSESAARPSSPGEIDLAVLPFEDLSAGSSQEYFADGVTEALIANLARIEGLHVISRTSSMRYKDARRPLPAIAGELGVDFVVEGTVTVDAGRVRVTAQLIDAVTDRHLWAHTYDRAQGDILSVQAELAGAIARNVDASMTPAIEQRLSGHPPVDPAIYELYAKGRHAASLRTPRGLSEAVRYFEMAAQQAPEFGPAHAGLASTFVLAALSDSAASPAREAFERARAAGRRALEIDPGLAEAEAALAVVRHRLDWQWAEAEAGYRRAIDLRPSYATAHEWYAAFLAEQGRHRQAQAEAEFALELDPFSAEAHRTLGLVHYYGRRFALAADAGRRALALDPASASTRLLVAWSVIEQGDARAAIAICEARSSAARLDDLLATLAEAYRRTGQMARAAEIRQELLSLETVSARALVRLHLAWGDLDAAFAALEEAVADRSEFVTALKVDPLVARMRGDPRFSALVARAGLAR